MTETMLTTAEAAERLNRSERTIQLWAKREKIPGLQRTPEGIYLIPESSLDQIERPRLGRPPRRETENAA